MVLLPNKQQQERWTRCCSPTSSSRSDGHGVTPQQAVAVTGVGQETRVQGRRSLALLLRVQALLCGARVD